MTDGPRVVACVPDLMDRSKLMGAARASGATLELVAQPSGLVEAVGGGRTDLVIVDLTRSGALDALRTLGGEVRTLGFGSHVDRELLEAARLAGCSQVMARSAFFGRLDSLLAGLGPGRGDQPGGAVGSPVGAESENG